MKIHTWILAAMFVARGPADAFEIVSRIHAGISSQPIKVSFLVKPGVSPENRVAAIRQVTRAYQTLEDIPTCGLRFTIQDTVLGYTGDGSLPPVEPGQTFVIIGNRDELTTGGASLPNRGNPGGWKGAVADQGLDLYSIGLHEIGHSLGLGHSTIGLAFPGPHPIMHWAATDNQLAQDDIAALSLMYPDPIRPIRKETGCITGRVVASPAPGSSALNPIPGVNAVAVNAQGRPVVAFLTHGTTSPGRFELCGLPPGSYTVRFLDGTSYRGRMSKESLALIRQNAQVYMGPEPSPIQRTLAAGDSVDVGDQSMKVEAIRGDSLYLGADLLGARFQPLSGSAIPRPAGGLLDAWIHLKGGVRGFSILGALTPRTGLQAQIVGDSRVTADAINGNQYLHLQASIPSEGLYIRVPVIDKRNITDTLVFTIGSPTAIRAGLASARPEAVPRGTGGYDALGREPRSPGLGCRILFHAHSAGQGGAEGFGL